VPGTPPVMTADTVNCPRQAPDRAAVVMTTVPVTVPFDIGVCVTVGHVIIAGGQAGDVNRGRPPGTVCERGNTIPWGTVGLGN